MARKPTDYVQLKLRIRESLRRKIEKAAEKKAISANAEAVERIQYSFDEEERHEAFLKEMDAEMEERRSELEAREREYYEEQAREKATLDAALRSAEVLKVLVGGDDNAKLLRLLILGLGNNPDWAATPETRKAFADKVRDFLISADLKRTKSDGQHPQANLD